MEKQYKAEREEFVNLLRNNRFDAKFYYRVWKQQKGMHSCLRILRHLQGYEICTLVAGIELMVINQKDNKQKLLERHCLKYLREAKKMAAEKEDMETKSVKREQAIQRGRIEAIKRAHTQLNIRQANLNLAQRKYSEMTDIQLKAELNKSILQVEKRHLVSKHQAKIQPKIISKPNKGIVKPSLKELLRKEVRQIDKIPLRILQLQSKSKEKILEENVPDKSVVIDLVRTQPIIQEKKPPVIVQIIQIEQQVPKVEYKPKEVGLLSKIWSLGSSIFNSKSIIAKKNEKIASTDQKPHIS